eukprot:scaffold131921_cov31-Tisochrysis_lutea.AAC.1
MTAAATRGAVPVAAARKLRPVFRATVRRVYVRARCRGSAATVHGVADGVQHAHHAEVCAGGQVREHKQQRKVAWHTSMRLT